MAKSIEVFEEQIGKLQAGYRRFIHDILPIAIAKLDFKVDPPVADVILVPEPYWRKLRDNVWTRGATREEWENAKAVAVFFPASFENRLRVITELQRTDTRHNYDQNVDYNAIVFLRLGAPPTKSDEESAVLELYAALASSCFSLAIAARFGRFSVCPISNPFGDRNAEEAMRMLTAPLTPEEFAKRYGSE